MNVLEVVSVLVNALVEIKSRTPTVEPIPEQYPSFNDYMTDKSLWEIGQIARDTLEKVS